MFKPFKWVMGFVLCISATSSFATTTVEIAYLGQPSQQESVSSNIEPTPADLGEAGAQLAIQDNDSTGKFVQQNFKLTRHQITPQTSVDAVYALLAKNSARFVVLNVPASRLEQLVRHPDWSRYVWLNAGSRDDVFRQSRCQPNLLHTLPGRAMQADALAQYLVSKRWTKWALVRGQHIEDQRYAAAITRAAKRFGAVIQAQKVWNGGHDARRTAQAEVPLLTQMGDYDVLIVADEKNDFGDYFLFRTWLPRPVAGTQGLVADGWHAAAEQWGATQLQNRFKAFAKRPMLAVDYAAWAAVRTIGEAATRTQSNQFDTLVHYIRSPEFELAAFKGRSLSYRTWNGELRQPVFLAQPRALVSTSPQEGFLHPHTDLDTLGFDQSEVRCYA